jgi:hypothetical protein
MDVNRTVGAHLDVRDPELLAYSEDHPKQSLTGHAIDKTHRCRNRRGSGQWRWFDDGGE